MKPRTTEVTNTEISDLVDDNLIEIFGHLQPGILKLTCQTNRRFYKFATTNLLWKKHFQTDFPIACQEINIQFGESVSYHQQFAHQKRNAFNYSNIIPSKLQHLIEENNISGVKSLLKSTDQKITTLLHYAWTIALINNQNNQALRDFFFDLVYDEFLNEIKQKQNPHHHRLTRSIYDSAKKTNIATNTSILTELLQVQDEKDLTIFHWACMFGQMDLLQQPEMLAIHPDIPLKFTHFYNNSLQPINYETYALKLCAHTHSLDGMRYLLKRGANPNLVSDNYTALLQAARFGYIDALRLLIKHDAALYMVDRYGKKVSHKCPLRNAGRTGYVTIIKLCLEEYPDYFSSEDVIEATKQAVSENNYDALMYLYPYAIKHGASPDHLIAHVSFDKRYDIFPIACLSYLLSRGANADSPATFGDNLLGRAVTKGNIAAVRLLLQHKADVNIFYQRKYDIPLYRVIFNGFLCYNYTQNDELEMVKLLVENGAKIVVNGASMIDVAKSRHKFLIAEYLMGVAQQRNESKITFEASGLSISL